MKRREPIMFSKDGQHWRKGIFLTAHDEPEPCATITLDDVEWIVRQSEICTLAEYEKVLALRFYESNKALIDAWTNRTNGKSKAEIARELNMQYGTVLRIIKKAEEFGSNLPCSASFAIAPMK